MEEQTEVENDKKIYDLMAGEWSFRLAGKPRKWEDWGFGQSIQERRAFILNKLKELIWDTRKKDRTNCKLALILARHFKFLEIEPPEIRELYLQVLRITGFLTSKSRLYSFSNFISSSFLFEDSLFWRQIVVHNLSLANEFQSHHLNWEQWSDYGSVRSFETKNSHGNIHKFLWKELNKKIGFLLSVFGNHPLYPALRKDCIAIKKNKKAIFAGELIFLETEWWRRFFPNYYKGLDYLEKKKKSEFIPIFHLENSALTTPDSIKEIILELAKLKEIKFSIKLWDRYFGDLYSGNRVGNCLAIGKKGSYPAVKLPGVPGVERPAGILDYLVDQGVQTVNILEHNKDDDHLGGQCYLFVFLDNGQPVLMVDSIEIFDLYKPGSREKVNLKIRDELFEFLRNYARAVGIERVVLAKNGPILECGENKGERHVIGNDVDISDLPVVNFEKIEKLGGYWNHQPYFLESVGGTEAFVIM
ncbi:MAG: hypothetical protein A3I89_02400 [Candidatus Harrisonbacteria bacterium RIFCSPLOWO2_02_FULL_41_11]|uniref:Uncharacterized protein n=1 Tax=Candidatus Harrisonbacteria bacterium RIFCSPHIGHO2_02_FULL_42_16 TaxID=1798404 RepID=A0A1G1ZJE9_9BACT|nr:MAG: hypothetical protein A3B92_03690 [Candidatus Harrisonbacteria bacterium RIFCSPHIGHO2_02_FULL_42_16]OGY66640.1 MAG: hypothetical protein A3I89_02400 [Candidatus Harrisonbacteria bacterium RIFCSPLOWO2_02_FULL_41_11]